MLDMKKSQQMTDVIHVSIPYSGIEHAVISTPIYNRLHRVLQSSLVFLTYPSNKVKRFEHSIGVMHLAGNIFFNSICNTDPDVLSNFMNQISDELIKWRENINFDKYSFVATELRTQFKEKKILNAPVPVSHFYNKFLPRNLDANQLFSYFVVFQAIRLAGLLHDVGHLPYSHILEHALKKIYNTINNTSNPSKVEKEFLNIMKRFAEGKDEIHEEIGKLLVLNIKNTIIQSITEKSDPNIYFFLASFDFAEKIISSNFSDNTIYADLHLITASVLDADRLDYCSRDAFCSGTDRNIFAYDRFLETYKLIQIVEDNKSSFYFCPSSKSVSSIEDLLRRRKTIFAEINFHHRVHKHEILLEEVISRIGIDELKNMKKIDPLPYTLPLHISSIWQLIAKLNSSNDWPEYQIIQLDDSWLDTLLKHKFFELYGSNYLSLRENGNDILWNRFDELISSTRRYKSFLKRAQDFREFDKQFFNKLKDRFQEIDFYFSSKIPALASYSDFYEKYHSFLFNYCIEILCLTDSSKERFFKKFEKKINDLINENDLEINDCLLRSCMFSFGYQTAKTPLFISDSDGNSLRIEQISSQLEGFQKERAVSPIFHLYYLPKYITRYGAYEIIKSKKFMEVLVNAAVDTIVNFKSS